MFIIYVRSKHFLIYHFIFFIAFSIGKGAVAGGAVIGLGSLCYYGLGLSPSMGAVEYAKYIFSNIILFLKVSLV